MSNKSESTCCTCGFTWVTGTHGAHSCTEKMAETIADMLKCIKGFDYIMEHDVMPQVKNLVFQNYGLLNETLMASSRILSAHDKE
jgi:hypothetical protein